MAERGEAGMTLLELVVALGVLALITAGLAGTLRFGVSATSIVDSRTERLSELASLHAFLRGQIETARAVYWRPEGRRVLAFEGTEGAVEFVSKGRQGPTSGGLFRMRLAVADGGLVLSSRPLAGAPPGFDFATATRRIPLSGAVSRLSLSYLGRKAGARTAEWHREWRGETALPELLRLRLGFADGRASPPLVIALVLGPAPR